MQKKSLLLGVAFILIGISMICVSCQNRTTDQPSNIHSSDSALAFMYSQKGEAWAKENQWDSALVNYRNATTIFKKIEDWDKYCVDLNKLAVCYFRLANFDSTIQILKRDYDFCTEQNGGDTPLEFYLNLGNAYLFKDILDTAYSYLNQGLVMVESDSSPMDSTHWYKFLNSIANFYLKTGRYDLAYTNYRKTLNLQLAQLDENHLDVAKSYTDLANASLFLGKCDSSIFFYNQSLAIRIDSLPEFHRDLGNTYYGLGEASIYCKGNYEEAHKNYELALVQWQKTLSTTDPYYYMGYGGLGNVYYLKSDYDKAIFNYQKALIGLKGTINEGVILNHLGSCFAKKNDLKTAIANFYKSLDVFLPQIGEKHNHVVGNYYNLAIAYSDSGLYDSSNIFFQKALDISQQIYPEFHPRFAEIYDGLGWVNRYKRTFDLSKDYFQKAIRLRKTLKGIVHPDLASTYHNIGLLHEDYQLYDSAIAYYQKGVVALGGELNGYLSLANISSYRRYFEILGSLGSSFQKKHLQSGDSLALISAYDYYTKSIKVVDSMRISYQESGSKLNMTQKAFPIYEGAIKVARLLATAQNNEQYIRDAFTFAEKSKSVLLTEAVKESQAKQFAGLPDSLIEKEQMLKIDVAFYENKILDTRDSVKKQLYQEYLADRKTAYYTLLDKLKLDYPEYHKLKYDIKITDAEVLKKQSLQSDQAIIEYFMGDSCLFTFVITQNNIKLTEQKIQVSWEENWTLLKSTFSSERLENDYVHTWTDYIQSAHELYEIFIKPISSEIENKNRLIIVPDGFLNYIPFELLLSEVPEETNSPKAYSNLDYLLKKYQIQYAYSSTLWMESLGEHNHLTHNGQYLAIAPFASDSTTNAFSTRGTKLNSLYCSKAEVEGIDQYFQGIYLMDTKSTNKSTFLKQAGEYGLLHLSTHGEASVSDPKLIFRKANDLDTLYMNEIYNTRLKAEMVVLSACETGLGQHQRGEGVMSIGRAFNYAGVSSLVMSLWQVADCSTAELMELFYETLAEGMAKDEALRIAKLRYLEKSETKKAPYYWAGFILSGNAEPLTLNNHSPFRWWYVLVILGLVSGIVYIYSRSKR